MSRRVGERMRVDWMEAGMPEELLQNRQSGGAWVSISCHMACLNAAFSGPCSCTMLAFWTAAWVLLARLRRPEATREPTVSSWVEQERYPGR
jgi:hypothetical protein